MKLPIWDSLTSRKRKLTLWVLGLVLFYTVAGFLIVPPIVRAVAVKVLSQQLDREVSIEKVKLNPYALSCTIRGLLIKDKDGEPFVSWDEVYVNIQLASLVGHPWVFKEISVTKPFVRAQMNKDGTFNFTDLLTKFSTNTAPAKAESRPLVVHVERFHIGRATAALADFTPRTPFKRVIGPMDINLENLRTDPDNDNPSAFTGTTDAGGQISWSGSFCLIPLRSQGELKLFNFPLQRFAPLYQDLVRFEIRSGTIGMDLNYRFELSATNRLFAVHDTSFGMRDFTLGVPGDTNNMAELGAAAVTGLEGVLGSRKASVDSVLVNGGILSINRAKDNSINVIEMAKPAESLTNAPGGILFLLRSVTNAVTRLLNSTNEWSAIVRNVNVTNCALHLEDDVNSRPAKLDLTDITLDAKNISNTPGTNLTAAFSARWNKDGSIKTMTDALFLPPTADIQIDVDQLDLGTLDPYLEPKLNLYILGSKVSLHGKASLRTTTNELPQVTFQGDASLDNFKTVDGVMAEDLVKWDSVGFQGIDANLNPETINVREIDETGLYARLIVETNMTINLLNALRIPFSLASVLNGTAAATNSETAVATTNTETAVTNSETAALTVPAFVPTNFIPTNFGLPQISVGAVVITNTAISFSDRSLKPNVNLIIQSANGTISGLSTKQLQPADLALNAMIEGVGPANITGTINPFDRTATNNVKVTVRDMDLVFASPYSGKYAGYQIAEGKLNLDLAYELVGTKINSKNLITLDQFNFGDKVDSPDATSLPVRLGIAILKDRDGKVVLDVPVEGDFSQPDFRIYKVVMRAIENILIKVATSPFSLLGALFGGGGEELGYQDFAAGSFVLTAESTNKLESLSKALYARPALNLEISGSVDPDGDRQGLQRIALDRDIRSRIWTDLHKSSQATNSVDQLVVAPDERVDWIQKLYGEAVAAGKITPELVAANTNLAAYTAQVMPHSQFHKKLGVQMVQSRQTAEQKAAAAAAYHTLLVPPPEPKEALLLATYPVSDDELKTLADNRAKAVQAYFLQTGKVEASRLFIKAGAEGTVRQDGPRVYLQFR
jgi:hypothetical protein